MTIEEPSDLDHPDHLRSWVSGEIARMPSLTQKIYVCWCPISLKSGDRLSERLPLGWRIYCVTNPRDEHPAMADHLHDSYWTSDTIYTMARPVSPPGALNPLSNEVSRPPAYSVWLKQN